MAKSSFLQNNFTSGELSELIKGRTDTDQYFRGMQLAENVVTVPQGGVKRRMGSEFVAHTPVMTTKKANNQLTVDVPNNSTWSSGSQTGLTNDVFLSYQADGTPTGYVETDQVITSANATNGFYIVWEANTLSGDNTTKKYIDIYDLQLHHATTTGLTEDDFVLLHSTNGSTWYTVASVPTVHSDFPQTFRIDVSGASSPTARYWRLAVKNVTSTKPYTNIRLSEIRMFFETPSPTPNYKIHSFDISREDSYLLVFDPNNIAVYQVTDTATTKVQDVPHFNGSDMPDRVAVNENILLGFHENKPPMRLVHNFNGLGRFALDTPTFQNIPQLDYNDSLSPTPVSAVFTIDLQHHNVAGARYQLEINGIESKNLTCSGSDSATQIEEIRRVVQEMPLFGSTGISVTTVSSHHYQVTCAGESAITLTTVLAFPTLGGTGTIATAITTTGSSRKEDFWSATRGYPRSGVFANGRLWFGGTKSKPSNLLASVAGDFLNFKIETGLDDEALSFTINGSKSKIIDVSGGRGVHVFTESAEYNVTGNTPATINAEQQTQHGSFSVDVPTMSLDGATLFIDSTGRSLKQFLFNFNENAYRSIDLSVLASKAIVDPVDMDIVSAVSAEDANYVFIINSDGSAVVLNTLREQDINGFTRFNQVRPQGEANIEFDTFEQCVTVNNVLHVITKLDELAQDTVHDEKDYAICRMTFDSLMDCSTKHTSLTATIDTGLRCDRQVNLCLRGASNDLLSKNIILDTRVMNNGVVTLTTEEQALVGTLEIGFNFVSKVKTMPIATAKGSGANNNLSQKRVDKMNLRVVQTQGVKIDGVPTEVRQDAIDGVLSSTEPTTGIIEDSNGGNGWNREVTPEITVESPTPFNLLAIDYEISS